MARTGEVLPVLPNTVPYNELLFRGKLKVGDYDVKTRSWNYRHRGLTLLYTSTRVAQEAVSAYKLNADDYPRGVIVGVGNLVNVRELTDGEGIKMLANFNNISLRKARKKWPDGGFDGWMESGIWPLAIGFFFLDLRRFKEPIPFKPPRGAVRVFHAPLKLVERSLKEVGL